MKIKWDRVRIFLILLFIFGGLGVLVATAWLWNPLLGGVSLGVSLLFSGFFLSYLTDDGTQEVT